MAAADDVAALFLSTLGRPADPEGLAYFTNAINRGGTVEQVREALAYSPEGQRNLGTLFQNVLGREADPEGLAFFTDALAKGEPLSRIRSNIAYSPEAQGALENIYTTDLKRPSDAPGLQFFTDRLASGGLLSDVGRDIRGSEEALGLLGKPVTPVTPVTPVIPGKPVTPVTPGTTVTPGTGNVTLAPGTTTDNSSTINSIFQTVFGRDADPVGLKYWGDLLAAGKSVAEITAGIRGTPEGVQAARGIRTVPFGSQLVDGRVQQVAQYAQPAVQAGQAMGAPSLQSFLAGRQGQVSGGDLNTMYRNVLGRAPDPGGVDYYNAKLTGGTTLADVEAEMRGSAEFRQPLAQFQQQMQYQTALPGMIQPFNPADIPKTFQQTLSPGPRLDISKTAIPGWLQASINAQKVKDGIEVSDADKFAAANADTTSSGLNPGNVGGTTGANTGGLLAANQISPQIISGYGDYVGVAPGSIDLPGASYWQNLLNKGTPIADIYSGMAGTAAGLLYAPTRAAKLAAAATPAVTNYNE